MNSSPENIDYKNPTPVAVSIVPVLTIREYEIDNKLVAVPLYNVVYARRGIQPKKGMLALPGGFVNEGESIETAGARELKEETGLDMTAEDFLLFKSRITPNNRVLITGIVRGIYEFNAWQFQKI